MLQILLLQNDYIYTNIYIYIYIYIYLHKNIEIVLSNIKIIINKKYYIFYLK